MKFKFIFIFIVIFFLVNITRFKVVSGNEINQRLNYYQKYSAYSNIPWYLIGAIDQYERNTKHYRSYCSKDDEVISICIESKRWSGFNNPIMDDQNLYRINLFHGMGQDGNHDGLADRNNPDDRIYSLLNYIIGYGSSTNEIEEALLNYYQTEKGVQIIFLIGKLFQHYNSIDLSQRVFPIPKYYRADYSNNFGTGRSYGGNRIHEGIDIFAHYGTPVISTAYGVIEIMGWNNYGGYRIGIRDMYNTYQYYAHLSYFAKGIKVGDMVEPGQIIGSVGSTGYGKEGTSGRFPPHLHFGFYKFDGRKEWSFNPYIYLRKWDRVKVIK